MSTTEHQQDAMQSDKAARGGRKSSRADALSAVVVIVACMALVVFWLSGL